MSSVHSYHDEDDAQQRPDGEPFGDLLNAFDPTLTAFGFAPVAIIDTAAVFTKADGATLQLIYAPTGTPSATGGTLDGHGNAGLRCLGGDVDYGCQCRNDRPNSARPQPSPSVFDDCGQPMPSFSGSQDDFLIQPDNRHFGPDTIDPGD